MVAKNIIDAREMDERTKASTDMDGRTLASMGARHEWTAPIVRAVAATDEIRHVLQNNWEILFGEKCRAAVFLRAQGVSCALQRASASSKVIVAPRRHRTGQPGAGNGGIVCSSTGGLASIGRLSTTATPST